MGIDFLKPLRKSKEQERRLMLLSCTPLLEYSKDSTQLTGGLIAIRAYIQRCVNDLDVKDALVGEMRRLHLIALCYEVKNLCMDFTQKFTIKFFDLPSVRKAKTDYIKELDKLISEVETLIKKHGA